uniref:AMP-dependent synthetase/ligase domain-containing protein n=1 Tax=Megaselia scalaris TaxID=36166 RepID=T1GWB0_MEGSC
MGLTSEDFIGLMASNTTYLMPVLFGSLFVNIPCHPIDVTFSKEAISYSWSKTKPKLVFCDGSVYNTVKEVVSDLGLNSEIYTLNDHVDGVKAVQDLFIDGGLREQFFQPLEIENGDQTAIVLCSSGSTGLSKAVTLSHKYFTHIFSILNDTDQDIVLTFSSLYWLSGTLAIMNAGMTGATHLVISEPFTAELALHLVDKYKVTKTLFPPRNIALLLNSPDIEKKSLKSLNVINCGGAKLPVEIRKRIKQYLNPACLLQSDMLVQKLDQLQLLLKRKRIVAFNTVVKIIDENGNNLGIGEDGEICVNTNIKWNGYYGDQEATDEVYDIETGWYKTGDMGHFDDEGYLYIVDRIKEIMKSKGYHISPSEIEELVLEIPEVADICVVGIPDVVTINLPAALIIRKNGSTLSQETIQKYVADKMPHYKHLTGGVYFVDSLPRTPSGKILRRKAREVAEKMYKEI